MSFFQITDVWIDLSEHSFVDSSDKSEMYIHYVTVRQNHLFKQPESPILQLQSIAKKRRLLFISGYGASGSSYFELFGELHKHFEIFIPDLLGFGSSGRPEFLCQTTEETAEYFVVCLRKWMDKTGFENEGTYSIMAHSLGCWVASLFAV